MTFKYQSGEEIKKSDRVLFHGKAAEIEIVAEEPGGPETEWYIKVYGGGVMIRELKAFGSVFVPADQVEKTEDLEFVARADGR